jgi:hypothetical protein
VHTGECVVGVLLYSGVKAHNSKASNFKHSPCTAYVQAVLEETGRVYLHDKPGMTRVQPGAANSTAILFYAVSVST